MCKSHDNKYKNIIKCQYCDKAAKIYLQSTNNVKCNRCKGLNYSKGENLIICGFECNNYPSYEGLKYSKKDGEILVTVQSCFLDECNHCGNPMLSCFNYVGKRLDDNVCEYCYNEKNYELTLENDIVCTKCNSIMFNKNIKLDLCSTKCKKSSWRVTQYLTSKDTKETSLIFQQKSHQTCNMCKTINNCKGKFVGVNLKL